MNIPAMHRAADAILDSLLDLNGVAYYKGAKFIRGHWEGESCISQELRALGPNEFHDFDFDSYRPSSPFPSDQPSHEPTTGTSAPKTSAGKLRLRRYAAERDAAEAAEAAAAATPRRPRTGVAAEVPPEASGTGREDPRVGRAESDGSSRRQRRRQLFQDADEEGAPEGRTRAVVHGQPSRDAAAATSPESSATDGDVGAGGSTDAGPQQGMSRRRQHQHQRGRQPAEASAAAAGAEAEQQQGWRLHEGAGALDSGMQTGAATASAAAGPRTEPAVSSGGGAGLPGSPAPARPTGPVYVLWDLDNKYPIVLDHTRVVENLRRVLGQFGAVAEIRAFCNYQTLNHVPQLWGVAMELGMEHPLDAEQPEEHRCPLCGRRCKDAEQLAKHFKQLHEREHKKRMSSSAPKKVVKRYMESEKREKYVQAAKVALPRQARGFNLEGILKAAGVAVTPVQMGPQRADVALEEAASQLLRSVHAPLPSSDPGSRPVLAIVSDDRGFEPLLKLFESRGWRTVSVCNGAVRGAGAQVHWAKVVDL
ncbi:hypothetical protein GPECTOR_30g259 [Gonium pectorale]|uniref:C2H2-type domain-containing protein n=1 Tax=Gonium pectorale TaxID=33097 RepID=A0A150GEF9_GONPE|nr:hypothetical protein GPECTOR_30g259 [Gonium pectorale]|eukprot:KXZ48163.1 hypothetical protein GPECTOR_30g259 [Gonium pectorale]